ncbi:MULTISPECIES: Cmx/CmrA family chloramphenicol efflux MFS transporter [unclassified Brevibacterium]|uniref:Cmx/CmrA family chloramphenicol efflux MFS transporter n=1 Tax=unclassified Brevibacterium TaxID=2614124 RepID=UPI0010F665AC|nr:MULTISPECIES: Cmx/CmrA family chloramphenicol efflux MFS transporter [unclassified Brevibacterium]MCM1013856.1 MFS transporter [Brevibacterium sp. XM4083]
MPVLLYLLALAVFAQGTSEFVLVGLLTDISRDLDVSLAEAGLLTTAFAVGMVVGAPVMAAASRRFSPRSALTGFLVVFVLAHVGGALTDSFPVLVATRSLAAVANAGFLAVTLALIPRLVAPGRQGRAIGVVLAGTTLALIAGVPAGAFLAAGFGWRSALWVIAALCVPALLGVLAAAPGGTAHAGERIPLRAELATLRSPDLLIVIAVAVLVNAATFGAFTYLAAIAEAAFGLSGAAVPVLLAVFGIGAFCGVSIAGRFADAQWRRLLWVLGPVLVLTWVGVALTVTGPETDGRLGAVMFWALTPLVGFLSFATGSTLIARIVATAAGAPALGGSFATVALNLGAAVGPILTGLALQRFGPVGPFGVSAVCAGLGLVVILRRLALVRD